MARIGGKNDGVYGNTKRGLVKSGALTEDDLEYDDAEDDEEKDNTPPAKPGEPPLSAVSVPRARSVAPKQVDQKTYVAMATKQKASADANYLKYKQGKFKK